MESIPYPSSGATEEVNPAVVRPPKHIARPQAIGDRITVALIPVAEVGLRRLQERTNLSKTDLANRAITSYEFIDAQQQAGRDLIIRDRRTGESQLVRFL
jgi:hypothetical protein